MGFGRSFLRGFGWGLGRSAVYHATRSRTRRKPLTDKQRYEQAQVRSWIREAQTVYRANGIQNPSFDEIRKYVWQHHHYKLTK